MSVVDAVATPSGMGAWMVNELGDVVTVGDAAYHGSPAEPLEDSVVAILATPGGRGYHLVTAAGSIRSYGDARSAPN